MMELADMTHNNAKFYGSYTRKDGKQHVCLVYGDGKRKTVSYPKHLMEIELNRYLNSNEFIHHVNHDFTDNRIENLKIVNRNEHGTLHTAEEVIKGYAAICSWCGKQYTIKGKVLHYFRANRKRNKVNCCSKKCSGKYGKYIQELAK